MGSKALACGLVFPLIGFVYQRALEAMEKLHASEPLMKSGGFGKGEELGDILCYGLPCVARALWVIIGANVVAGFAGWWFIMSTKVGGRVQDVHGK